MHLLVTLSTHVPLHTPMIFFLPPLATFPFDLFCKLQLLGYHPLNDFAILIADQYLLCLYQHLQFKMYQIINIHNEYISTTASARITNSIKFVIQMNFVLCRHLYPKPVLVPVPPSCAYVTPRPIPHAPVGSHAPLLAPRAVR